MLSFLIIIAGIFIRVMLGVEEIDKLVIMAFTAIMIYVICLIAALFPATWRMTDAQKKKIGNLEAYQNKYRKVFVILNLLISMMMVFMILVLI